MEKNDIKKALYKQNPKARFDFIKMGSAYYNTTIRSDDKIKVDYNISFEIPVEDMGEAKFGILMNAKLLIRWITQK